MARLLNNLASGRRGEQHFSAVLKKIMNICNTNSARAYVKKKKKTVRELACLTPSCEVS
jgi:hypothetical protein